jgi:hypothetical protein
MSTEKPTPEDLLAELKAVQAQFLELEARFQQSRKETEWLEENLRRRTRDLNERVKELRCLYEISRIFDRTGEPVHKVVQQLVESLPGSMQFPEQGWARAELNGRVFQTGAKNSGDPRLSEGVFRGEETVGRVEIGYARRLGKQTDFLPEEQELLREVARRLGKLVEERGLP